MTREYIVHLPDGSEYGPVDRATLAAWRDEGRLPADALVWPEGAPEWTSVDEALAGPAPIGILVPEPLVEPAPVAVAGPVHATPASPAAVALVPAPTAPPGPAAAASLPPSASVAPP